MTDRKVMQQALEALELEATHTPIPETAAAMAALRARLAEPEPEPVAVAWRGIDLDGMAEAFHRCIEAQAACGPFHQPVNADAMLALRELRAIIPAMKAYTAPPARSPLADEEIDELPWCPSFENPMTLAEGLRYFARAIERAHNITGGNDE